MYRLFDNPLHLVLLLVVVLIVFGAGKLPSVGAALGQSIKEFKKATVDPEHGAHATVVTDTCAKCQTVLPAGVQFCPSCGAPARAQVAAASDAAGLCTQCGARNLTNARFCAQCGAGLSVHAG